MRLIDADALVYELTEMVRYNTGEYKNGIAAARLVVMDTPTIGGWISVKDRLPEKEGQYLCWFGNNPVFKGAAIATYLEMWKAFGSLESLETYSNVTHWMSIEPPKENEDD